MLKYLVILLDDTSVSFCHYRNDKEVRRLIPYDDLKSAIIWAMKENLMVQFVYPNYTLPIEYVELIDTIDHVDIAENDFDADVLIVNGFDSISTSGISPDLPFVLRITAKEFFDNVDRLSEFSALTIVFTDMEDWGDDTLDKYKTALGKLSRNVSLRISSGESSRVNLVMDRMQLSSMNNCGAGDESITFAPDGQFYICPAFYLNGEPPVGTLEKGVDIPNAQLYKRSYAPICRNCDAYNCKRCIWLNKLKTHEVNTPGREQCVMAHLERNESRRLLESLKSDGIYKTIASIPEIDYLDPFEKL